MKKCPFCNSPLPEESQFCLSCMKQLGKKTIITVEPQRNTSLVALFIVSSILSVVCICVIIFAVYALQKPPATAETTSTVILNSAISNSSEQLPASQYVSSSDTLSKDADGTSLIEGSSSNIQSSSSDFQIVAPPITTSTSTSNPVSSEINTNFSYKTVDGGIEITGFINSSLNVCAIPSLIDGKTVVGIADSAFYYDSVISSVTLPDTLKYIGNRAFYKTNIKSIIIPKSVQKIGNNAFTECNVLSEIYIASTNIEISTYAFSTAYQRSVDLTIYASSSVMNKITALNWDAEFVEWYE